MVNAESLRHAVREVLATRPGAALDAAGIARRVRKDALVDFPFDDGDLLAALDFLRGLDQAQWAHDGLGATKYWQITSAGTLAFERNL
jgi:hypothetical protein